MTVNAVIKKIITMTFSLLILTLSGCEAGSHISDPNKNIFKGSSQGDNQNAIFKCRVNVKKIIGPVQKGIFGTNLEWFNNANGIWKEGVGLDKDLVHLAKDQGIRLIRFPGGTFSDFYDWKDGTGPQQKRPVRPHFTDPGKSRNVFGTPELVRFCELIGADPLLTVNAGTGTSDSAAQWVSYTNSKENPKRISDGFQEPFNIKFWEIGNELYLNGSEAEKKISIAPEKYAQRFIRFSNKMRAVDPDIFLMAIGVAGSYSIPFGPYHDWNETVLAAAHDHMDYIALHNAYFPVLFGEDRLTERSIYQALWASAISVDQDLSQLEKLISKYDMGRDIGIAVTEWGPFFSIHDPKWMDHVKTLGSAVYVARIYQVLLSHPRVRVANYFKFTDNTFMGWVAFDGKPKVPYYVVKLFANFFGDQMVQVHMDSPTYRSNKIGLVKQINQAPELTAIASISNSGDRVFVSLVNCGWEQTRKIQIKIPGFIPDPAGGMVRIISGSSPLVHNGPDLPDWWPVKTIEPDSSGNHAPVRIREYKWNPESILEIPPHSIIMAQILKKT